MVLDRDLHFDVRPRLEVGTLEMGEGEQLLQQRRPASARRVADLSAAGEDRRARAPRDVRDLRRQVMAGEQPLERSPVDLEPDESPGCAALALRGEGAA